MDDGVLAVCDELLRDAIEQSRGSAFAWQRSLAPLGSEERATIVWAALDLGGDGAWNRLLEDPEMTVGEALEYASGVSAEELEAAWRAQVLEHAPQTHADLATTKWTALFWILLLGALAMRSTRWRLG